MHVLISSPLAHTIYIGMFYEFSVSFFQLSDTQLVFFPFFTFCFSLSLLMDPYKQYGYSEGCSSSESGWTTYIVSPMEEDGSEGDEHADAAGYANGGYCSGNYRDIIAGVGEAESDDSMASDASSGPCYQSKGGGGENVRFKNHEKGNKKSISMSISSSFTKFMSSSKDKKSEDQKRADRKLPTAGSRKRWK